MLKRMLSLMTALFLIFGILPGSGLAAEPAAKAGTMKLDLPAQVNPLYSDAVFKSELKTPAKADVTPLAQEEYLPEAQAAVELRKHLKNRTESFTVYVEAPNMTLDQEHIEAFVVGLFESALAHTGDPVEGDYLRWQYGRWGVPEIQYGGSASSLLMAIPYTVEYYTTAAQEAELDRAIDDLLKNLDLDDVCDYEKVGRIYDYIIHNVTYDYDNLNNHSNTLKYTAYAALMNQTAICQGYSVLFYRLALELGVDARLVPGDSDGNGTTDHAWNIVQLQNRYYGLDATFDSEIGQRQWFLLGTKNFTRHTPDYSYVEEGFQAAYPMSETDFSHSATETVTAPTCTEKGYTTYTCSCGHSYTGDEVDALGHKWDAGKVTKEPTETEAGVRTYTCQTCKATREEEIPVKEHEHAYQSVVTAHTCTEKGYTTYTCSCGDSYTGDEVEALGHKWDNGKVTREPTETETGVRTYTCHTCKATREEEIPVKEHEHAYQSVVTAPTCTEKGYTTYTCSCGHSYTGDEVAALGHEWDSGKVTREPTETEAGVRTYTCQTCKATREEEIPVKEHEHAYQSVVTAPTCTEKGYTTYTCSCGHSYIGDEVEALGHTGIVDAAVPATCTENGLTEGSHCAVCDLILVAQETVDAKGHHYEEGICADCGAEDPDDTEPTEPSEPEETEPTEPSEPEETEPTKPSEPEEHTHTYGAWVIEKEPTSTEPGIEKRHCVCGACETRAIPKLSNPFSDVKAADYFYEPVLWAAHRGITTGMTATSFGPGASCTRAQVVTFLWRAAGAPEPVKQDNPFRDVVSGAYYYKAVLWAVEQGITTGMSSTQFGPDRACTRGQVVTFLWRARGETKPVNGENTFSDVQENAYYYHAVLWAVENGITAGMGNGKFAPDSTCTRGQIVTFLYRAYTIN